MFSGKLDSMVMREALKILCLSNGWSYGVLWGFDQTKPLLLTLRDAYYEEDVGALIGSMLPQVHVLGGGVIGQIAFTNDHQWIHWDENFELFQDDSEFYSQFFMGIKTIALISIEQWGVVQFGSTENNPETKCFIDQVRSLFREVGFIDDESHFSSEGSMEINDHSLIFPSQSFLSTSTNPMEDCYLLKPDNMFDCSVLTSSWPHSISEEIKDSFIAQDLTQLTDDCKVQRLSTMEELLNNPCDKFSQWFSPVTTDLSHSTGLVPLSCLSGNNSPIRMSKANSTQSSFTLESGPSGPEKPFYSSGCKRAHETLVPVDEKYAGVSSKTSLFSKLGLDQLLDGGVKTSPTTSYSSNAPTKRRKTESCPLSFAPVKSEGVFSFEPKRETSISESCFMEGGNTSSSETAKTKKKAKAGSKPRPKDRQMIQDRLGELRKLIPNGEKVSIDRLLERTIRYMTFTQSLIKHAESLREINKSKNQEIPRNGDGGGMTWACEVGGQSVDCPLIVEDLATPGQMLIEMLCDELGFFLEISDAIRGFGFIILKCEMEVREPKKIWAHFLVQAEATKRVTRHDVFSSLIRFLQATGQNAASANVIMPSGSNCQPTVRIPVDSVLCANI